MALKTHHRAVQVPLGACSAAVRPGPRSPIPLRHTPTGLPQPTQVGLNTVLLWAHLHGNEAFNLVSSRDDDRGEGGGGSDSDSDEATPDVLMLKVNLPAGRKQQARVAGHRCPSG